MVFVKSNLPVGAQPWGRQIEKAVASLETTTATERVNNAARDAQAALNVKRLDASLQTTAQNVSDIQTITDNVFVAGTTEINGYNIKAGTIDAETINAGTLTGFTIQTGTSGQRVVINENGSSNRIDFYSDAGYSGFISGSTGSTPYIEISSANSNADLTIFNDSVFITTGGFINLSAAGQFTIDSNSTINISPGSTTNHSGTFNNTGSIINSGNITSDGNLLNNSGYIQSLDTYNRNVQSGRIMYVASNGTYNAATSSARYKQDIAPYQVDISKVLQLEPVSFRYKMAVSEFGDKADIAHGFIAEQADQIGLTEFVDYMETEDGSLIPDNFRYIDFTAALVGVIKQLNDRIEALEGK